MRNFFIKNFTELDLPDDKSFLLEGFYISELLKVGYSPDSLKYYKTNSQVEVDLIIDNVSEQIPIEIKFKNKIKNTQEIGNYKKSNIEMCSPFIAPSDFEITSV